MDHAVPISAAMDAAVKKAIAADLAYQAATGSGRKFGITGEVGEILICRALGLKLVLDPRSAFDALDNDGCRVQIKTRRGESDELPKDVGRISKFSPHECDYVLLGILNRKYELVEIRKARWSELDPVIRKHKGRNPTIREFKKVSICIFPAPKR